MIAPIPSHIPAVSPSIEGNEHGPSPHIRGTNLWMNSARELGLLCYLIELLHFVRAVNFSHPSPFVSSSSGTEK